MGGLDFIGACIECLIATPLVIACVGFFVNIVLLTTDGSYLVLNITYNSMIINAVLFAINAIGLILYGNNKNIDKCMEKRKEIEILMCVTIFFPVVIVVSWIVFLINATLIPTSSDYLYGLMIVNYVFVSIMSIFILIALCGILFAIIAKFRKYIYNNSRKSEANEVKSKPQLTIV
jgi:hypothetical protein